MLRETHQDLVVRSSDFRVEKSAWERPLWIVVLHLNTTTKKEEKLVTSLQNQKFESQIKLSRRQEAVSLWMMWVQKITNI